MTNDTSVRTIISFVFIAAGIVVSTQSTQECSFFCVCDSWYGLQRSSCTGRHLYSIDTGAPGNVQALDLSDNVISLLSNYELANAGFTELKYLNLSKNTISEISLNAFSGLGELTILDLSRNHLYYLLSDVFVYNKKLRIVKLSRNNFNSHVPKLQSSSITELSLDSCQISHLPLDTFNGLKHIRRLNLSNNQMIQMSSSVLQTLYLLRELTIEGNPWSCNKIMQDLQIYLKQRNVEFEEVCGKKTTPKKFEKMILAPVQTYHSYPHSGTAGQSIQEPKSVTKQNMSNTIDNRNQSTCENIANQTNGTKLDSRFMPYWFLFTGFLVGISSGMVISYIWLSGSLSCNRRYERHNRFHGDSQRLLSVFDDLRLLNHIENIDSLVDSCPGTPPPPYREVMLRPHFYPCPSTASNLNNNDTGYRDR